MSTRSRYSSNCAAAGVALFGAFACAGAAAQELHPGLHDRWHLQVGMYRPTVDTTARLNSSVRAIGTEVNFEDDLNLSDRKTLASVLATARLGDRWKIEAEYLSLSRSGSRALGRTINWGDNVYTLGTTVRSEFDSNVYRLSGGYAFVREKNAELGVSLGLHVTDFEASIATTGLVTQTGAALAPLPVIGLYGAYAFTPRWLVSARVDYFSLNYNEYEGSMLDASIGVDYRFARHFGVGLAYRHVDYDLEVTKGRFNGAVNYRFGGPMLYFTGSF